MLQIFLNARNVCVRNVYLVGSENILYPSSKQKNILGEV